MEQFFNIILLAVVVEGIITYVKTWFVDGQFKWQQLVTVVFGVLIAVAYNIDLIAQFGAVSIIPYLGNVLTGVLISRGSNYVNDLIKSISSFTSKKTQDEQAG